MNREKLYRHGSIGLVVGFIVVILGFVYQYYNVKELNNTSSSYISGSKDTAVEVNACDITEATDTWETILQISSNPDYYKRYYGSTCAIDVQNNQKYYINNWTLRMNIYEECYLNGFWCGSFEIHQFRDGEEIVDTIDSQNFANSETVLEKNEYSKELMIHLTKGDYIVYIPSKENNENIIKPQSKVGAGAILYYEKNLKITNYELTYYNHLKYTEGPMFIVFIALAMIWLLLLVGLMISFFTYRRTKKEVDTVTQSIINGLSREFKTLWLVNVKNKTIQLIRNYNQKDVSDAMKVAKDFEDYDVAIKYYIDHYVDKADRERVWKDTAFDSIVKHLTETDFFTVNFLHHAEGMQYYYQMAFTRVEDAGKSDNIVLAYRDIDGVVKEEQEKQHQLEVALVQAEAANKAKSQFLANMSHEIRTPINAVLGMDAMILRESSEDTIKGYARDIKAASNTLLSLINDILDFSKIESGKMEIIPTKYQLDSVINDLMNMIKPKADEKGLDFELILNPNTPAKLYGDEIRVKQVILNILNNAVKYTREGKVTWLVDYEMVDSNKCKLKIDVVDTGIGIKQEELNKIYSPYERVDNVENKSIEGTGLGLSITKNLLEKMGSELKVESTYGEGSKFFFEIEQPMWGEEPIGENLIVNYIEEEQPEKYHAPSANILVVDDVEMNIIVIKSLLKRVEIAPDTCFSGEDAIELANQKKYDIILLDAMMPNMSGEETLKHIRESEGINKDTTIIVLTANAIVGAREEYLSVGFDDYLSKPINGELLENVIQKYLPKDKLIMVTDENQVNNKAEKNPLIKKLEAIEAINVSEGIKASGGEETYINVCSNFFDTAKSRIQMISDYYEDMDYDNYAIQTHALKSSARLIGAIELSELALEMEHAGKEKNEDKIKANTQRLLDMYKNIQSELSNVFETKQDKKELPKKKLDRKLKDLKELVEAFDFESAKMLFASLKDYSLPAEFEMIYEKLKSSMAEVNNVEIITLIDGYLNDREDKV